MKVITKISKHRSRFFIWLSFLSLVWMEPNAVHAQDAVRTTKEGVIVKVGGTQVELAPVNAGTFRIGISGSPEFPKSSFLADSAGTNPPSWRVVKERGFVGIHDAAGELLINPQTGQWRLKDSHGRTLISKGAFSNLTATAGSQASGISVTLDSEGKASQVYGGGNGTPGLLQAEGRTRVANGVAEIPYYWSPAGYAVLAVSANDNLPARWESKSNCVVWNFSGATADLFFMPSANLREAARSYADLTGHAPVPPRWAMGYLQSRWGWQNRAYIEETLKEFHDRKIPVDAFIYDFEWYTTMPDYGVPPGGAAGFSDFGWNAELFPQPKQQIEDYQGKGIHFVGIRKPRLGNSDNLEMIRKKGWDVRGDGAKHTEKFQSRDVDFKNADFEAWYVQQTTNLLGQGVDGWWDDEGEGTFTTYYYWNMAQAEALAETNPRGRLWTLNRAFSPGLQRLGAAAWTGDISSTWKALEETPTSLLNWSLAGMPYGACDIGGFHGQNPSPEMLSRWMEAGVFFPVMRSHSSLDRTPRFPWLFGPEAEAAIRKAIEFRYRLIPFYYSLAHETFETGMPIMRPLVMEFPGDPKVSNISDQWLMGDSLMTAPVLQEGGRRQVYLPPGQWYVFGTNTTLQGGQTIEVTEKLDEIPVYVKSGAILPLGPVIQHTSELPGGPLEVQVYPGKDATFTLVEDDGVSTGYLTGQVRRTTFTWHDSARRLSWQTKRKYAGPDCFRSLRLVVFDRAKTVTAEGALNEKGSLSTR